MSWSEDGFIAGPWHVLTFPTCGRCADTLDYDSRVTGGPLAGLGALWVCPTCGAEETILDNPSAPEPSRSAP